MSKIQDAIDKSRERSRHSARTGEYPVLTKASLRKAATGLMRLDGRPSLSLDPVAMERSCVMPFIEDRGVANAYSLLRTRLLQRMRDNKWKSLMVSGTLPNDGKTTTAINVAIGASQDVGQAVLLVDMDLERPSVAGSLGLERTTGLSDYLTGNASIDDIFYNSDVDRLLLLPNFEKNQTADSFLSLKMLSLLEHIKKLDENLLVVFDMPPVLVSDSVLAIAPHVDTLLLVVSDGRTSRSLLKRANQMIEDIPRVGTVLNRSLEGNAVGYY